MTRAADVPARLREIAALLGAGGADRFRSAAYERAARSLETAVEDVESLVARRSLTELPDVGPGTARVVEELVRTGHSSLLEDLRRRLPRGTRCGSRRRSSRA